MATYAIGDVRGNFQALSALLEDIRFNRTHDTLRFTGNLVGPGLDSLAVAVWATRIFVYWQPQKGSMRRRPTVFSTMCRAPDRDELLT